MHDEQNGAVVVGIDGSAAGSRALDWAADEADPAHEALDTAGWEATLLVVGCRRQGRGLMTRLGPLASWLLHHSRCPVAIVGQPADTVPAHDAALDASHRAEVAVARPAN